MRCEDRALGSGEAERMLDHCEYGMLSTSGKNGYPYDVPVSFVCIDGLVYFHSAKEGHKMESTRRDNRVSFCVVGETKVIKEEFILPR